MKNLLDSIKEFFGFKPVLEPQNHPLKEALPYYLRSSKPVRPVINQSLVKTQKIAVPKAKNPIIEKTREKPYIPDKKTIKVKPQVTKISQSHSRRDESESILVDEGNLLGQIALQALIDASSRDTNSYNNSDDTCQAPDPGTSSGYHCDSSGGSSSCSTSSSCSGGSSCGGGGGD